MASSFPTQTVEERLAEVEKEQNARVAATARELEDRRSRARRQKAAEDWLKEGKAAAGLNGGNQNRKTRNRKKLRPRKGKKYTRRRRSHAKI